MHLQLLRHFVVARGIDVPTHGQSVTQAVSYSLRYVTKTSQRRVTPKQNRDLGLWKYAVLPISFKICAISRVLLMCH